LLPWNAISRRSIILSSIAKSDVRRTSLSILGWLALLAGEVGTGRHCRKPPGLHECGTYILFHRNSLAIFTSRRLVRGAYSILPFLPEKFAPAVIAESCPDFTRTGREYDFFMRAPQLQDSKHRRADAVLGAIDGLGFDRRKLSRPHQRRTDVGLPHTDARLIGPGSAVDATATISMIMNEGYSSSRYYSIFPFLPEKLAPAVTAESRPDFTSTGCV
jgi:hypothetical protein